MWTITSLLVFVLRLEVILEKKNNINNYFYFSIFIQMAFTIIDIYQINNFLIYLKSIPIVIWLIYFIIWPITIIIFNEVIKIFEIK